MSQYLLSTYAVKGEPSQEPPPPEAMQAMMERTIEVEAEMESTGTFVFGGRLHGPDAATVVRTADTGLIMTDGPFVAGFGVASASPTNACARGRRPSCTARPAQVRC